nr:TnpV protein [uncultured Oscillibacter sp.]
MNNQSNDILTYTKVGDYYIPDLAMDDQPDKEIGIYGRMRERYLKEHHPGRYSYMLLYGTLYPHLLEIDKAAQRYLDTMIPRMAAAAGVTEELKARDQMTWVGKMNAIRAQVEEIIRVDLIYC